MEVEEDVCPVKYVCDHIEHEHAGVRVEHRSERRADRDGESIVQLRQEQQLKPDSARW